MTGNETTVDDVLENWPYERLRVGNQEFRDYISIFTEELSQLRSTINELEQNFYIEDANGPELIKLGQRIGVSEQGFVPDSGSTESIRYFIQLQLSVAASDGTARAFENVLSAAFGTDALSEITVNAAEGSPELVLTIPPDLLENQPTTQDRLVDALNRSLPCGTGVQIVGGDDIFTFRSDASNAADYEAGFGEGVWS